MEALTVLTPQNRICKSQIEEKRKVTRLAFAVIVPSVRQNKYFFV